ncbi:5-hydroxytryptamine receptor 3A-like isoform X2 [Antennarius striatus]|uniref:5-hydroxytryptamine receptor 3A-like isoform X2 n=1 Tax=Antennarius striatus TaxID=241820 RepID=UPI0035B427C1
MAALRLLLLLLTAGGASGGPQPDCSYLGLLKHLQLDSASHHLTVTRPVQNWTRPTYVWVDMLLYSILQVDEKVQTVTSHIWRYMTWTGEFLSWNSTEFCGIPYVIVPASSVWIPDVSILEDVSDTGSTYRSPVVKLYSNGFMSTYSRQRLTTTCHLKLRLFPFDTQRCNITFLSMSSGEDAVHMGAFNNGSALTKFSEQVMVTQGEWQLRKMEIVHDRLRTGETPLSEVVYMVTVVRKPMLYVINLIVPLFALLLLDVASFFIHEARGEKLSFKVTVLLSISVLLLILKDMLPSTEDQLPMIANYCVAIFGFVGFSVLEAILVSHLIDLDGYFGRKAQRSAQKQKQQEAGGPKAAAGEEKAQVKPDQSLLPLNPSSSRDLLQQILEAVTSLRKEADRRIREQGDGSYRRVAEIIDTVFFSLYFIGIVVFLSYMYSVWIYYVFQ